MGYLLTRPPEFGGDYKLVIERLEPFFAWLAGLEVQACCFILIWFCAYFIVNKKKSVIEVKRELLPLFAIFFISIVTKWLFVSSASYGPGVGDEMKYYDMADSLNRGFFSIVQTHVAPPLYPLSFLLVLVFRKYTFDLIKLINAIVSSSIVFLIYFLCRSFLDDKKSLLCLFESLPPGFLVPYSERKFLLFDFLVEHVFRVEKTFREKGRIALRYSHRSFAGITVPNPLYLAGRYPHAVDCLVG